MKIVEREMGYFQGKPAMILKPAGRDNKKRFVVKLDDLWKYSDTHNEDFAGFLTGKVMQLCQLFEISVPTRERQFVQMMASISDTIMDGIDDLVKMAPYRQGHDDPGNVIDAQYDIPGKVVGTIQ